MLRRDRVTGLAKAAAVAASRARAGQHEDRQEFRRDFQKTVAVPAGAAVKVEHRHGSVEVVTHALPEARISARIRVSAQNDADAAAFGNAVDIEVQSGPTGVIVRTRYPERSYPKNISFSVDYDLTVPESSPLRVTNRFGTVNATGLKAGLQIDNGHGSVVVRETRGASRIENQFGSIEVTSHTG